MTKKKKKKTPAPFSEILFHLTHTSFLALVTRQCGYFSQPQAQPPHLRPSAPPLPVTDTLSHSRRARCPLLVLRFWVHSLLCPFKPAPWPLPSQSQLKECDDICVHLLGAPTQPHVSECRSFFCSIILGSYPAEPAPMADSWYRLAEKSECWEICPSVTPDSSKQLSPCFLPVLPTQQLAHCGMSVNSCWMSNWEEKGEREREGKFYWVTTKEGREI